MAEKRPHRIVVAGGGIAGIEFVLALRALLGDDAAISVVSPSPDLTMRPSLVAAPLGLLGRQGYPLSDLASDIGFTHVSAAVASVDPERTRIIVRGGDAIPYDTLVLALGARTLPAFDDAIHLGDAEGARGLEALHEELRRSDAPQSVAFVVPARAGWTLPLYEAALLMANGPTPVSVSLHTPEAAPLEHFGHRASAAVAEALLAAGVRFVGGGRPFDPATVDHVVTVPLVRGPQMPGVPATGLYGLIPIDRHARVADLPQAYAIGDATDYPVKQGAIACQQADAAAESVAARCGLDIVPVPFEAQLRATLLTGSGAPILLNGGQGPDKLPGRHLGPYLAGRLGRPAQPA
jgi:sulfide:quinone oxidoreductase